MSETPTVPALAAHRADEALSAFGCTWRDGGLGTAWVYVCGELDLATSPRLERTLRRVEVHAQVVVLNLRELTFIDCCGLHVIRAADLRARLLKRRLIVVRGSPQVDRLFALTGASTTLEIGDLGLVQTSLQRAGSERGA